MGYQTTLLDDLRRFDVPVIEIDGWRTRGKATMTPRVGVNHHTVSRATGPVPSLWVVTNGRPGLPGPLCNVLGGRDHVARLIAAGRSNNAGEGSWKGITGNSNTLALEMEHTGIIATEEVTEEDIDFMARIQAAFAWNRYPASMVCQHYEWAPNRKIDFVKSAVPDIYTPDSFRRRVEDYLRRGGVKPTKPPAPKPPTEDEEIMGAKDDILNGIEGSKPHAFRASKNFTRPDGQKIKGGQVYVVGAFGMYPVNRNTLNGLYFSGDIRRDKAGQPQVVDPIHFEDVPMIRGTVAP